MKSGTRKGTNSIQNAPRYGGTLATHRNVTQSLKNISNKLSDPNNVVANTLEDEDFLK